MHVCSGQNCETCAAEAIERYNTTHQTLKLKDEMVEALYRNIAEKYVSESEINKSDQGHQSASLLQG